MRKLSRLRLPAAAALSVGLASAAPEVRAQDIIPVGPGNVLISEFRLSGPGGASDEYIEFYCNRDTDCDISNYVIQAHDPSTGDFTFTLPSGFIISARQFALIADTSQYTLNDYSQPDLDVHNPEIPDFFIDNQGFQLRTPVLDEPAVIDSVGFIGGGNSENYIEGTGLQPATGARPSDQYAYVRKRTLVTNGTPQDTNDNAADFVLVSVTGTAHPGITEPPVLGAPGPKSTSSPKTYSDAEWTSSLVEPAESKDVSPNRVRTGAGNTGTLSIRRSITNNTTESFDYIGFRVIEIPTVNSPNTLGDQAQLRLVTSQNAETFENSQGRTVVIRGTILEFDPNSDKIEPQQPNGGGLNSSIHASLGEGEVIAPGETVDVQFLLNVDRAGLYRFFLYVEAFPATVTPLAPRAASKPREPRQPVLMRHILNLKRGTITVITPIVKKAKKKTAVAATAGAGATPATPAPTRANTTPTRATPTPTPTRRLNVAPRARAFIISTRKDAFQQRSTRKRSKKSRAFAKQKR